MQLKTILLFGMPRSGTTWLGKVFDSHPGTLYRHEPDSFGTLDAMPLFPQLEDAGNYGQMLQQFVATLPESRSARITGKLPLFPKVYLDPGAFHLRKLLLLASKALGRASAAELPLPAMINRGYSSDAWLVWKSIESLGRLGVIASLLPDCHAVQILRHPCGYVSSVLRGEAGGQLGGDVPASEDVGIYELLLNTAEAQTHGLTLDGLRSLQPVERLAWRWVIYNEKAINDCAGLTKYTRVRYEDLCADPVTAYQALFAITGLPWDDQTAAFVRSSTEGGTGSYYSVYRNPLEAAQNWQQQLAADDIERVLAITQNSSAGELYGD
ncbi:sulfotransferase [Seongchinamella sediminis]|uniref:Sulfotransferase n=1 Tax=Seongchinamella sediminis TaxID=2283635 RepID=A0A3L7DY41_9GAMM|nr:sulfotransferase [Seongchinamella sediminis]RLQ20762.1 sulfotransferase [Seongchinamella sediminis]